jgi:RIO kinase 1
MAAYRSTRRSKFDDDGWEPSPPDHSDHHTQTPDSQVSGQPNDSNSDDETEGRVRSSRSESVQDVEDDEAVEPPWSTYVDATHGPQPVPGWVVTDARALDTDYGVLKTGKEADVSLLERVAPDGSRCLLAVKQYRSAEHRMFHRDAGYLEGRRVRRSREMRAMATRTEFGRDLLAGQWAAAEFEVLSRLWSVGAAVPYPVQLIGTELMMEFIGTPDGVAAPRLAQVRPERSLARLLYDEMVHVLTALADAGYAHGDLSPYNVLVDGDRIVLIDLPQAIDLVGNPQGFDFLMRDCVNITTWFANHGVPEADAHDLHRQLLRSVPGLG